MIDRESFLQEMEEEKILREYIRRGIKIVQNRKEKRAHQQRLDEEKLRSMIRKLIILEAKSTDVSSEVPHRSTGINVLEDLLKKIIPVVEDDYKSLTTDENQRNSFRAHIINAVKNSLAAPKVNVRAGAEEDDKMLSIKEQDIDIKVDEDPALEDEAFIDVRPEKETEEEEPDEREDFGIEGEDKTGRNVAYASYNKVETNIIDAYDVLSNDDDRETFYDYLITNLKLYFDKFEDELKTSLEEPTTPEYEQEKDAAAETELGGEEELGL